MTLLPVKQMFLVGGINPILYFLVKQQLVLCDKKVVCHTIIVNLFSPLVYLSDIGVSGSWV